ncbi:4,5-DOPA dioxygenase extradiol [Candidatus Sodalis endolongispinus]|uniref:4,5-DOPA dioxygenase extradiol n=1 Tax=Candidatus Sodalis endolongispinus TaxID=2812662 RepID=A0ABS5Y948_9GAMM|nr:4,5-DOPA dioxygenase extradiol [Candidatus Sodalis endolongispinus]MBT9431503.1 4,5-DOPA dioxygenase extradiol [Candidatus Sodalis endolongispinus]
MSSTRMPALFLGHGSPMNVLEDNRYTRSWRQLGQTLPRPEAILAISAHWYRQGTAVTAMAQPRTVHDFGGFPQALFDQRYPAPGSPALAQRVQSLLAPVPVQADIDEWGLDHGSWGVLIKMYPEADIPVVQLSIDATRDAAYHYALGRKLAALRDEGVMLVASGNVVHNLRTVRWQDNDEPYPWATSFNQFVRENFIAQGEPHPLIAYQQHQDAALANPSPEHFLPLLYVLGSRIDDEPVSVPVDGITLGSISMLSVQVG